MSGLIPPNLKLLISSLLQTPEALALPEAPKEAETVNAIIDEALLIKQKGKKRKVANFYPSSIVNGCIVKEVFKRITDDWEEVPPEADRLRIMEAGNGTHQWFQSEILSRSTKLFGRWVCKNCHQSIVGYPPKFTCGNVITVSTLLGSPETTTRITCFDALKDDPMPWIYHELRIEDPTIKVSGRIDGIIMIGNEWFILELKSTSDDILNAYKRSKKDNQIIIEKSYDNLPFSHHVEQASIYTTIIQNRYASQWGLDPAACGGYIVTYVSRDSYKTRSFRMRPNTGAYVHAKDKIDTILTLVKNKTPLNGQKKCKTRNDTSAKECPFRLHCFPYKRAPK